MHPRLVEQSLVLGQADWVGSEMWSLELERPLLHLEWSLPEQSPDLERLLDTESSLDLELLLFSPLLPEPDLLLVLDWDPGDRWGHLVDPLAVIREKYL
jgi:hypothetical protein